MHVHVCYKGVGGHELGKRERARTRVLGDLINMRTDTIHIMYG